MKNFHKIILTVVLTVAFWALGYLGTRLILYEHPVVGQVPVAEVPDTASIAAVADVVAPDSVAEPQTPVVEPVAPADTVVVVKVKKVYRDELQSVLNSGNVQEAIAHDFKNRLNTNVRYKFEGLSDPGDISDPPQSYNMIIDYINLGHWAEVTVLETDYTESDRLRYALMRVHYPEQ